MNDHFSERSGSHHDPRYADGANLKRKSQLEESELVRDPLLSHTDHGEVEQINLA